MNDMCQGCYGGKRFSSGAGSYGTGDKNGPICASGSRPCDRCHGSGKEPIEELLYVAALNRRVLERSRRAA